MRHRRRVWLLAVAMLGCGVAKAPSTDGTDAQTGPDHGDGDGDGDGDGGDGDGDGAGEGDGDGDGGNFVTGEDVPTSGACDPFLQDCEPGFKCSPFMFSQPRWEDYRCVPVLGNGTYGESCTYFGMVEGTDDCDAEHFCWDENGIAPGVCLPYCEGSVDDPACPPQHTCLLGSPFALVVCEPDCDPLLQDCGDGFGCYWLGSRFQCSEAMMNAEPGEACTFVNACAPGGFCAEWESLVDCQFLDCCTPFCDIDDPDGCAGQPGGTACVPFFTEETMQLGFEQVGICLDAE